MHAIATDLEKDGERPVLYMVSQCDVGAHGNDVAGLASAADSAPAFVVANGTNGRVRNGVSAPDEAVEAIN